MNESSVIQMILQGGSFGVLAYLAISWLPKAVSRAQDSYDNAVKLFTATQKEQQATFQAEQRYEREQCQKQFDAMMVRLDRNSDAVLALAKALTPPPGTLAGRT